MYGIDDTLASCPLLPNSFIERAIESVKVPSIQEPLPTTISAWYDQRLMIVAGTTCHANSAFRAA